MKRILLALVLALLAAVTAYAVYIKVRTNSRAECEIQWLTKKLSLTPDQAAHVKALHYQYCPNLNGLCAKTKDSHDPAELADLKKQCEESTRILVEKVCAELNPAQKEEYMRLVESWNQPQSKTAGKP